MNAVDVGACGLSLASPGKHIPGEGGANLMCISVGHLQTCMKGKLA